MVNKFVLETEKGRISLENAPELTVEMIVQHAELLGVKRGVVKAQPTPPGSETDKSTSTKQLTTPTNGEGEVPVSRHASPTPVKDTHQPKAKEYIKRTRDELVRCQYICPECGNTATSTAFPWFSFIRCSGCANKIYIQYDEVNRGMFGDQNYFDFNERMEFQNATRNEPVDDDAGLGDERYAPPTEFTPDIMDAVEAAAKKGINEMYVFSLSELNEYWDRADLRSAGLKKPKVKPDFVNEIYNYLSSVTA